MNYPIYPMLILRWRTLIVSCDWASPPMRRGNEAGNLDRRSRATRAAKLSNTIEWSCGNWLLVRKGDPMLPTTGQRSRCTGHGARQWRLLHAPRVRTPKWSWLKPARLRRRGSRPSGRGSPRHRSARGDRGRPARRRLDRRRPCAGARSGSCTEPRRTPEAVNARRALVTVVDGHPATLG